MLIIFWKIRVLKINYYKNVMRNASTRYVCGCFFERNIFLHNFKLHVNFTNEHQFKKDYETVRFFFVFCFIMFADILFISVIKIDSGLQSSEHWAKYYNGRSRHLERTLFQWVARVKFVSWNVTRKETIHL